MATWQRLMWGQRAGVAAAGLLLMLGPACAVNRRIVRIQTQVQLLNDSLASGQRRMDQDFEVMTQLMRQNTTSLEAVSKRVREMQQAVAHSEREEEFARLTRQLERLQRSAQELNSTMAEIDSRAEAMNEPQGGARYPVAASGQEARYESNNDNPAVKPNP